MNTMRRGALTVLTTALLLIVLTACVRFQAELRVNPDDTVDGSVIVAVIVGDDADAKAKAAASADRIEAELLPGLRGAPGVTREVYDQDGYLGSRFNFSGTPIEAFAGSSSEGSLSLVRTGDEFQFSGALDFSPGSEQEAPEDADTSGITVAVSFPGPVLEHNGEASGNTVRWETSYEGRIDMKARASAIPSGPSIWVWVSVAAGALMVAALAVVLVIRRRTAPAGDASPADPEAGTESDAGSATR